MAALTPQPPPVSLKLTDVYILDLSLSVVNNPLELALPSGVPFLVRRAPSNLRLT